MIELTQMEFRPAGSLSKQRFMSISKDYLRQRSPDFALAIEKSSLVKLKFQARVIRAIEYFLRIVGK